MPGGRTVRGHVALCTNSRRKAASIARTVRLHAHRGERRRQIGAVRIRDQSGELERRRLVRMADDATGRNVAVQRQRRERVAADGELQPIATGRRRRAEHVRVTHRFEHLQMESVNK